MQIRIYPSGQNAYADNAYWEFYGSVAQFFRQLITREDPFSLLFTSFGDARGAMRYGYGQYLVQNCNENYIPSGWNKSLQPIVGLHVEPGEETTYYNYIAQYSSNFISISCLFNGGGANNTALINCYFSLPAVLNVNQSYNQLLDNSAHYICENGVVTNANLIQTSSASDFIFYGGQSACSDLRSSGQQQLVELVFNGKSGNDTTNFTYTLGFNTPSVNGASNVSVSIPLQAQETFTELLDCSASFTGGVCRNDGVIKVYGEVDGMGVALSPFDRSDLSTEILVCQLGFESCCDDAVTCSITYNDNLDNLIGGFDVFTGVITLTRIEYSGFGALTDYCCDDVDCADESYLFEENTTIIGGGSSGGGDNVDITCICDNLLLIKSAIESNGLKIDSLTDSIDGLQISVDTTNLEDKLDSINTTLEGYDCVCENLEDIKDSIDNLELSPTITTPVTNNFSPTTNVSAPNVTNNVPVPSVTVNTDLSTINSNISNLTYLSNLASLSNLSSMSNLQSLSDLSYMSNLSELGQIDTGIANGTVDITDGIDDIKLGIDLLTDALDNLQMPSVDMSAFECDGVSIACILDEIDKKLAVTEPDTEEVKTITQVIAEKELNYEGGDTEVIIEDGMFADVTRKVYEKKISGD